MHSRSTHQCDSLWHVSLLSLYLYKSFNLLHALSLSYPRIHYEICGDKALLCLYSFCISPRRYKKCSRRLWKSGNSSCCRPWCNIIRGTAPGWCHLFRRGRWQPQHLGDEGWKRSKNWRKQLLAGKLSELLNCRLTH